MPTLTVHLREGFSRTPVVVCIDGAERYRNEAATTRTQIGLADMVTLELSLGDFEVEVRLPSLGRSVRRRISVHGETHLGVDLDESGRASLRVQSEPFHYM